MIVFIEAITIFVCGFIVMRTAKKKTEKITCSVILIGVFYLIQHFSAVGAHAFTAFVILGAIGAILEMLRPSSKGPSESATDAAVDNGGTNSSTNSASINLNLITFQYCNSAGVATTREVNVKNVGLDCLTGYCNLRKEIRTFRIDRITNQEIVLRESGEVMNVYDWITMLYPLPEE
ncbi:TPA: hypothetical protein ACKFM6_003699 [Enterobacter hormaechei]|uniref:WYL domain-containing protein n=1 Tax=Enterobacter hormaechei TaxID=158836 RepID=UPI0003628A32|nr:hypothetical protein [Enterobacter hormaechei]